MAFLFGGARPSGQDSLRDFQRQVAGSARGTGREIDRLGAQEKQLLAEIKRRGVQQDLTGAHQKAKELIRLRQHKSRLASMQMNLSGLSQELSQVHSSQKTAELMGKTTRMLQALNSTLDVRGVYGMLREFERQNSVMREKQEVLNETLDDAFEAEGEQDATESALEQVMQEVGLDSRLSLASAPQSMPVGGSETDLALRLEKLKTQSV